MPGNTTRKKTNNSSKKSMCDPADRDRVLNCPARIPPPDENCLRRKAPRQERSKILVQAILEAAAELFGTLGYARTTTNKIAERAGVSVGSLYQYFPNKDSLLFSLKKKHHSEIHGVLKRAFERFTDPAMDLEDGIRKLIIELVEVHRANPNQTKALSEEVLGQAKVVGEQHGSSDKSHYARQLTEQLFQRQDVRAGDPEVMSAMLGQVTSHLSRWMLHNAPASLDQALLMEEMVQMLVRYLKK